MNFYSPPKNVFLCRQNNMVKVKEHSSLYCGYFKPICGNNNIQLPPKKINFFSPIIYSRVASKLDIMTSQGYQKFRLIVLCILKLFMVIIIIACPKKIIFFSIVDSRVASKCDIMTSEGYQKFRRIFCVFESFLWQFWSSINTFPIIVATLCLEGT